MYRSLVAYTVLAALLAPITAATSAPVNKSGAKSVKKAPPSTPEPVPELPPEPVMTRTADGMMTPNAVRLRTTLPAETEANAVWNVRAALNIAALQCQYSPFLATVRNYNDLLRQHSEELDRARKTMVAHFKRYDKLQAQNSFDRYTTQTYNSFSTLDAQFSFCEKAAIVGREALAVRKGSLGKAASLLRDEVRAALTPVAALSLLTPFEINPEILPTL